MNAVASPPAVQNHANNAAAGQRPSEDPQTLRYALRRDLWGITHHKRLRYCGRCRASAFVGVHRRVTDDGATGSLTGVQTCGSVHVCSVCSAKINATRRIEIGCALATWHANGGAVIFGTNTVRHDASMTLAEVRAALSDCWRFLGAHRAWKAARKRLGSPGLIRVYEVTFSWNNGWHVHVHWVLLVSGATTDLDVEELGAVVTSVWGQAANALGLSAPSEKGQDYRLVRDLTGADLGDYLAKISDLSQELTQSQSKRARGIHSTMTTWDLARRAVVDASGKWVQKWREWESGSKGMQSIGWTPGLREVLGLGPEVSDDELAAAPEGTLQLVLTPEGWDTVVRDDLHVSLLNAAAGDPEELRDWLWSVGIDYLEIYELTPEELLDIWPGDSA